MRGTLLLIVVASLIQPSGVFAQNIDILRQGVVKVVPQGVNPPRAAAAGFIVRAEARAVFVVTASHVVEGAPQIGIEFFDERRLYPARVLGLEGGDPRGLAALIVENEVPARTTVLLLNRDVDVRAGEPVTMIGFPGTVGAPWAVTKGSIVGRRGKDIVFAGAIEAGNSGGPLVKDDQVVGLITQAQGQFAFATPSLILQYALESWGVRFGIRLRSTPAVLHESELLPLFKEKGFNHPARNATLPSLLGTAVIMESVLGRFRHEYETRTLAGVRVVIDHATGLMWQQAASSDSKVADWDAQLKTLNSTASGGFSDWRQPTIEELGSLIEARAIIKARAAKPGFSATGQYFVDAAFDYHSCPTADKVVIGARGVTQEWFLGVSFFSGAVAAWGIPGSEVCAVRTMTSEERRPAAPQILRP